VLLRAGFEVRRNDEPLVSPTCRFSNGGERKPALFCSREAARTAALLHSMDGWGTSAPGWLAKLDDKLSWWVSPERQTERQPQLLALYRPDVPDDGSGYVIPWGMVRYVEEFCKDHKFLWRDFTPPDWECARRSVRAPISTRPSLRIQKNRLVPTAE
jgi:hypothetical protein